MSLSLILSVTIQGENTFHRLIYGLASLCNCLGFNIAPLRGAPPNTATDSRIHISVLVFIINCLIHFRRSLLKDPFQERFQRERSPRTFSRCSIRILIALFNIPSETNGVRWALIVARGRRRESRNGLARDTMQSLWRPSPRSSFSPRCLSSVSFSPLPLALSPCLLLRVSSCLFSSFSIFFLFSSPPTRFIL